MGEVYEALEARLNRRVALKVVSPRNVPLVNSGEIIRRFVNEGRVLAQVSHPHLVTLFAVEEMNDLHVLVMEYIQGTPLNDIFSRYVLSADEAVPLIMQLLEGVGALHRHNILHRDLKPSNLILRPDGNLKILDLGIAKNLEDGNQTAEGVLVGTYNYLPPEVILGAPATRRSDLWAIGAIFYESLAGVCLNKAQAKKPNSTLEFPPESARWTPLEVRRIISRLCAPKPEHRYESTEAVLKDLDAFRKGRRAIQPGTLVALAKTVENLPEARGVLEASNLSSLNVKRALAVSAVMQAQAPSRAPNSSDDTDVITPDGGLKLDKKIVQLALNQFKENPAPAYPPPVHIEPSRPSNPAGLIVFALLVAGAAVLGWKHFAPRPTVNAKTVKSLSATSFELAGAERVFLKWTPFLSDADVQVSRDRKFIALDASGVVSADHFQITQDIPDGHYYWRVVNAGNRIAAGPFDFELRHLRPLTTLAPLPDQKIDMASAEKLKITLAWKCEAGARAYHVQISSRADFAPPVAGLEAQTCQISSPALAAGDYYWRVNRKTPDDGEVNWSASGHFTLVRTVPVAPVAQTPPPQKETSEEDAASRMQQSLGGFASSDADDTGGAKLESRHESSEREPASRIETPQNLSSNVIFKGRNGARSVELHWNPSMDAENYRIEVAPSEDFQGAKKFRATETTTQVKLRGLSPGTLYWRVRAEKGDAHSHWSDPGTFQNDSN